MTEIRKLAELLIPLLPEPPTPPPPIIEGGNTTIVIQGEGSSGGASDAIRTEKEAAHFLRQATLGVTYPEIQEVLALGSRSKWIAKQIASRYTGTGFAEWSVSPTALTIRPGWIGELARRMRPPETQDGVTLGVNAPSTSAVPGTVWSHRVMLTTLLRNRPQVDIYTDAQGVVWQDPGASLMLKCAWVLNLLIPASAPGGAWDSISQWAPIASWWAMLSRMAFRPYEELLIAVTYHPAMTRMLTHYRNRRTPDGGGSHPDENYAREIMQLMTIGLERLNLDGTPVLDSNGNTIPNYTNNDILVLSRIFTGLTRWDRPANEYDSLAYVNAPMDADPNLLTKERLKFVYGTATGGSTIASDRLLYPGHDAAGVGGHTVAYEGWHDRGAKYALGGLIDFPATTDPNVQVADKEIKETIRALVRHPSCAPFVCKRLIKHMVTANPSPGYVARVAAVFRDNGRGQVGDMASVWTAILTDPEATNTIWTSKRHGRTRLGFELFANHVRSFDRRGITRAADALPSNNLASIWLPNASGVPTHQTGDIKHLIQHNADVETMFNTYGSWPAMAPSIFGFHDPEWSPFPVSEWGYQLPEIGSLPPTTLMAAISNMTSRFLNTEGQPSTENVSATANQFVAAPYNITLGETWGDNTPEARVALVDRIDLLMCGGTLDQGKKDEILACIATMPVGTEAEKEARVRQVLAFIIRSTEFWVM
jgi:hypothetical protein